MAWTLLADAALVVHALWVLAVVLGPLWCWKRPRWRLVHLAMAAGTLFSDLLLGGCPLTYLEDRLAAHAGRAAYEAGFLADLAARLVYWDIEPRWLTAATGLWLLGWWAAYLSLWKRELAARPRRGPRPK